MTFTVILCATFFSFLATTVLSYLTMATPIGPWIGPMLVLIGLLLQKVVYSLTSERLLIAVVSASPGGILATAFGFSFPTFYFLDKIAFMRWASQPFSFIFSIALLAFSSGLLGLFVANSVADELLERQKLAFPIGALLYRMVNAVDSRGKSYQLVSGFISTVLYCCAFMSNWFKKTIVPATVTIGHKTTFGWITLPALHFSMDLLPLLWSIGFIAGSMITVPLLVGSMSKIIVVDVLGKHFFPYLSETDFLFAFCSGMVVSGALQTIFSMPQQLFILGRKVLSIIIKAKKSGYKVSENGFIIPECNAINDSRIAVSDRTGFGNMSLITVFVVGIVVSGTLATFGFSWSAILYSIIFAALCSYQMASIAGKIGLALLGRFATFVMIPGVLIFGLTGLQATVLATLVEAAGGVATDVLFGKKVGLLAHIDKKRIMRYQFFGLCIASLLLGIIFWVLVTHFELGSQTLFAERAQGRALLINAVHFDYYALVCGVVYGLILKVIRFNPMMVLGGLLMPLSLTLGLVAGGISSWLIGKRIDLEPLCSGMFAANSLCMLLQAFL